MASFEKAPTMTPRQKKAFKAKEAEEQSSKLKVALGAGGIGAACGLLLPVVGGVTLAACGAAAAVGLTTRSDDVGDAARASGQAAAGSVDKLREALKKNNASERVKSSLANAREKVRASLAGGEDAPLALEDDEPQKKKKKKPKGWLASWRSESEEEKREKREAYGAAPTASEAARLMVNDLAEADPTARRRLALELIRDLHPDKCDGSVAGRAVATTLTRVAVAVRDYFDDAGWESFEDKGAVAVAEECAEAVARDDF